jgi:hypothetical protein
MRGTNNKLIKRFAKITFTKANIETPTHIKLDRMLYNPFKNYLRNVQKEYKTCPGKYRRFLKLFMQNTINKITLQELEKLNEKK